MNESEYQALVEAGWRRPLTPEEQRRIEAWLAAHPGARAAWEEETALNQCLGQLGEVPLSSNFTAQVLEAAKREARMASRAPSLWEHVRGWFRSPLPRVAWALLLIGAMWFGYHQHQSAVRNEMARGLSAMASVATLSDPVVFEDFEAIRRLSASEDEELFALLTK
jgi:anti-sigma factor RsiW